MEDTKCCVVSCEKTIDATYWESQYQAKTIGWDLGMISLPIKIYIDSLQDKNSAILIPGCGNTYEAEYLLDNGFTNITVIDIAPTLVAVLKQKFKNNSNIEVILGDFFEHQGKYDLIIEQTFFCALIPTLRQKYVWKTHQLLAEEGVLAGLLFNRIFEISPPFGGSKMEYENLFKVAFEFSEMDLCLNSIPARANSELFIKLKKNKDVYTNHYKLDGVTCSNCVKTITDKILKLTEIGNVSIGNDFKSMLISSKNEILIDTLKEILSYNTEYSIQK